MNFEKRSIRAMLAVACAAVAGLLAWAPQSRAQEATLRFHTFVPPVSASFKHYAAWAKDIEAQSKNRIKIETYGSMQLGGKPGDLYNQAKDGVVDIIYVLPGYTPGVFPRTEVFELPFISSDNAVANSAAMTEFYDKHLKTEYTDVQLLVIHSPTPAVYHVKGKPIRTLEDLQGRKIRTPSAPVGEMLGALGANPVGIAGANITEAMMRGVVEGMIFPWSISLANKVIDAADSHTDPASHGTVLISVMNKKKYDGLAADLRKVIDAHSGMAVSKSFGQKWTDDDAGAIAHAKKLGHEVIKLAPAERKRWEAKADPVVQAWIASMTKKGHPGKQLVDDARALVAKHDK